MIPVFSFIAWSGTGKTTYLEKLIAELKGRGLRVAAVKHDAHEFQIDREGKDSWRFAQAGADMVVVSSATKCAVMEYRPVDFEGVISALHDVDLILAEGWHSEAENIIGIYREGSGNGLKPEAERCMAIVSDAPGEWGDVPVFPIDDPKPLADLLQSRI